MNTKIQQLFVILSSIFFYAPTSHADTFGSGANEFTIEFVDIGNPNNPDDNGGVPDPAGGVEYAFRMGKFEISRDMINKSNSEGGLGITLSDMTSYGGNGINKPATGVSWYEAARFVNWLNDQKGASPAYKFNGSTFELWQSGDAGYNATNPFRNSEAIYFLPSSDEWYKAAYYAPNTEEYYSFSTGSNIAPSPIISGTALGTAVYDQSFNQGPADITLAGGLSPYGTMGQDGNVLEWEETEWDLVNDTAFTRGYRGGGWATDNPGDIGSSYRYFETPTVEYFDIGFRVASIVVPEPVSHTLVFIGLSMALRSRHCSRPRSTH